MSCAFFLGVGVLVLLLAVTVDLPLRRVVLFSSGVGYFHRETEVEGNVEVQLTFRTEQIPDLLKSLVLQDHGGGLIAPVTYAPQEPLKRTLSSFSVDISDNPSLATLLDRLRGVPVEVKSDEVHRGVVMGVETQRKPVGDRVGKFQVINLLTAEGVVGVPVFQMKTLQIEDPGVVSDLEKALGALAQTRDASKRPITLRFQGSGRRTVSAGYLLETPVWKTSYRLVILEDRLHIQGWAIVENTTDDDWDNVHLKLVSGRPISFVQDLYEPLYVSRPVIPPSLAGTPRPRVHEGAVEEYEDEDVALADRIESPLLRSHREALRAGAAVYAPPAESRPRKAREEAELLLEALPQAMAVGEKVGELFTYVIDQPVTIGRQRSAMIPIVNAQIEGEKVSVFNAATDPKHPYNAVILKNSTGLHLMGGPVTVVDGGMYAGDALIDDIAPNDKRLLTYAVDLEVQAERRQSSETDETLEVRITDGVIRITRKLCRETGYSARSVASEQKVLLIEHPFRSNWSLVEPDRPYERTRSLYRFRLPLEPSGRAKLKAAEEKPLYESVSLMDADAARLEPLVRSTKASDAIKQALQKVIAMKAELADLKQQVAEREERMKEIGREQDRIRQNMSQLSRDSDLYNRYVEKLSEQETEFDRLRAEVEELKAKSAQQRKAVRDYIAGLNLK